jgi:hypothetical protein
LALVSERTIPSERPPLVGEVSANIFGQRCHVLSMMDPYSRILGFLDRSRYYFFQVAPQLYSRGWVDPVPDSLLLRKSGSAGDRTRDLRICSQELRPLDHRGGQLYSRGWVDPVPDPLLLRKSGSAGNLTRDLWICRQELWPQRRSLLLLLSSSLEKQIFIGVVEILIKGTDKLLKGPKLSQEKMYFVQSSWNDKPVLSEAYVRADGRGPLHLRSHQPLLREAIFHPYPELRGSPGSWSGGNGETQQNSVDALIRHCLVPKASFHNLHGFGSHMTDCCAFR